MIASKLKTRGLTIVGGFHPKNDEWFKGYQTVLLIGPDEPHFWALFTIQKEYSDGLPDAMDRYSKRVLREIAAEIDALAYFPSDGPLMGHLFRPLFSGRLRRAAFHLRWACWCTTMPAYSRLSEVFLPLKKSWTFRCSQITHATLVRLASVRQHAP